MVRAFREGKLISFSRYIYHCYVIKMDGGKKIKENPSDGMFVQEVVRV